MPPYWFVHTRDRENASDFEPGVEAEQIGGADTGFLVPAVQAAGTLLADGTASPDDWEPDQRNLTVAERVFALDLLRAPLQHGPFAAVVLAQARARRDAGWRLRGITLSVASLA